MNAGMGDVVFAPLYEVLRRRGVRFEFFHKLTNIGLGGGRNERHVARLELDVQARVKRGREYEPLVDIGGLPCWPSQPDFSQLVDGARICNEAWDLESQWDGRRAGTRTLRVGADFDIVVLGVALGVVPHVARELLAENARWRKMVTRVRSVPTQVFQLWLRASAPELGWRGRHPVNVSGFVEPFDTWADMTHLVPRESWRSRPRSIAYFCNVLRDSPPPPGRVDREEAAQFVAARRREVEQNVRRFLEQDIAHLWPRAMTDSGHFDYGLLVDAEPTEGSRGLDGQYLAANVRPSDRYTQSLPGTSRYRISPLERTYDNLTIAGDWTASGLNMGCVEPAVMSGLLAAHAITGHPRLADIIGYDHP
jgi:uncharacterized protein with NAD-binding domain and iron-sulfur cluster